MLLSAEVLQTIASATSVSVKHGKLQVQDGPFADTKEASPASGGKTADAGVVAKGSWVTRNPPRH